MTFQGGELRVGQKLWSILHGPVIYMGDSEEANYPIKVKDEEGVIWWYDIDGRWAKLHHLPTLYWSEVTFEIPAPVLEPTYQWLFRKKGNQCWSITVFKFAHFEDFLHPSFDECEYEYKKLED